MPKKLMYVEWRDGASLSQSRQKPGDHSPLTRDGDGNLGHVTLSDIDEDDDDLSWSQSYASDADHSTTSSEDSSELAEIAAVVIAHLMGIAYERAKPHVKQWWRDSARPALSSARQSSAGRLSQVRANRSFRRATPAHELEVSVPPDASAGSADLQTVKPKMSSDEAQQRLMAALIARAFSDAQIQVLLGSQIDDESPAPTMLLEAMPTDRLEHHVSRVLEANPRLHEELLGVFWSNEAAGGSALPLPVAQLGNEATGSERGA